MLTNIMLIVAGIAGWAAFGCLNWKLYMLMFDDYPKDEWQRRNYIDNRQLAFAYGPFGTLTLGFGALIEFLDKRFDFGRRVFGGAWPR